MKDVLIKGKDLSAFCHNLQDSFIVYGVREKEEGHFIFDEIDEFSDSLEKYKPTILPPRNIFSLNRKHSYVSIQSRIWR